MHVSSLINDLMKLHDVGVPEVGEGVDLTMHGHLSLFVMQVLLVVSLNRDRVLRSLMHGSANYGERTRANLKSDLELSQFERLLFRILLPTTINQISKVS